MKALISFLILSTTLSAQTILIDQGGGLWREGSVNDIPANRVVRVVRLDIRDIPIPPPKNDLKAIVLSGAKAINEPNMAETLAIGYATIAGQIERGGANSKAKILEAQKQANTVLLTSSKKIEAWRALLDKTWVFLDAEEAAGRINTAKDMAPYWRKIEAGLKESASATWEVRTGDDGPKVQGGSERITKEQWRLIIKLILEIILKIFGGA